MTAESIARRELETAYSTPELRAAYRAGMSTAFALCDERAAAYKRMKRGAAAQHAASAATACGNDIEALRASIKVDEGNPCAA